MKKIMLFLLCIAAGIARGEVSPVAVRLPEAKAWVGQRVAFYVELRARGSFVGTASFDLPQLPGTIIVKTGSPVVSTEEIEGESWFVQAHEFALFSQKTGTLEIPAFPVRFGARDGFTGPAEEVRATFPGARVEIQRPPGTEDVGFLVTTGSLEISQQWSPELKPVEAGAIFKRTIVQRAEGLSGMALQPPSTGAPESVKVYTRAPEVTDKNERGDFLGERRDQIIYQFTGAGSFTLPEIVYVWWNTGGRKLEKKTLPQVVFEVTPAPVPPSVQGSSRGGYLWFFLALAVASLLFWQRNRLKERINRSRRKLRPADKVLGAKLLRACRRNNSAAAAAYWASWRNTQGAGFEPGPELRAAVVALQRRQFGPGPDAPWRGDDLAESFLWHLKNSNRSGGRERRSGLPELNGPRTRITG